MFGYHALTHVILILLVIIFASVMSFMFLYNLRLKSRLKELEQKGFHPHSKAEEIVAEQHADDLARHRKH